MAKTNKQLQKEIDKLTIEKNNLVDMLGIAEKGIRGVSKILGLDGIAEATYFNDADIDCIIKTVEKLKADKKDLHKKLMEGLNCNNEKVEKIRELEDKVDEQFKVITKYEKELEEQEKENGILTEKYGLTSGELAGLEVQHKQLKQKFAKLEKENKRLENRKEEYLNERNDLAAQNNGLIRANNDWRNKCEELERKNKRLKEKGTRCRVEMVKREMENKKLEEKYEQCFEELSTKLSEESDFDILRAENEVIKQDKANLLAELTRQINEKSALRKENKRLKKRRREGRYNIDKFITNLTKGAYIYVEGASRPTKLHKRLTDAIAEKQRLEKKTGKKVYILTNL